MTPLTQRQTNLILFAREPKIGAVKTRLQATSNATVAILTYRALLKDTLKMAQSCDLDHCYVFYASDQSSDTQFLSRYTSTMNLVQQTGHDLGERMFNAFQHVNDKTPGPTVIIGTDCPSISNMDIQNAFEQLNEYSCVLGPTEDGGYYLLGLTEIYPWLFEQMPWSQTNLLDTTQKQLEMNAVRYQCLKLYNDVDTLDDLRKSVKGVVKSNSYRYTKVLYKRLNRFLPNNKSCAEDQ